MVVPVLEYKIRDLYNACAFNNSEQSTEDFVFALENAIDKAVKDIDNSHKEGLCLNSLPVLARYLEIELERWTLNR